MRAIRELGLLSEEPQRVDGCEVVPRDFFIQVVSPRLKSTDARDLVVLRVEVRGEERERPRRIRFDLIDRFDAQCGVTVMMRTTGYSLAVTALMQVDGRIREKGVRTPDEAVPPGPYIDELAARGIRIERTDS